MQKTIRVTSRHRDEWIDITARVQDALRAHGGRSGVVTVFVPHTTAAVTVQENADPPLKTDINNALERLFPREMNYGHCEDNAASHMKAVLVGASLQVPFVAGAMCLGTWQAIYLVEFDGPRERQVHIAVAGG